MDKKQPTGQATTDEGGAKQPLFQVRPTRQARRESDVGKGLFQTQREKQWVMAQLRVLYHWPLDRQRQDQLGADLDFSKVSYNHETFYELRLDDENLHQKNLRLFFWVHDVRRTIWIMHG